MSVVESNEVPATGTERLAGITDKEWWDWFHHGTSYSFDAWTDWLSCVRFPREGPLQAGLEYDIESTIRGADAWRLATAPATKTFGAQWATFRKHHEELDGAHEYRRLRFMVWRASALKALCERDRFQGDSDRRQARKVLHQTLLWHWPTIDTDGNSLGGSNFWRPTPINCSDGTQQPDALAEYAGTVLLLTRRALKGSPP